MVRRRPSDWLTVERGRSNVRSNSVVVAVSRCLRDEGDDQVAENGAELSIDGVAGSLRVVEALGRDEESDVTVLDCVAVDEEPGYQDGNVDQNRPVDGDHLNEVVHECLRGVARPSSLEVAWLLWNEGAEDANREGEAGRGSETERALRSGTTCCPSTSNPSTQRPSLCRKSGMETLRRS